MTTDYNDIILGIMSGTSLDGVDLCACRFTSEGNEVHYSIVTAETIPYSKEWKKKLENADKLDGLNLTKLHHEYGDLIGEFALAFIKKHHLKPALISSHGHTVFHQPQNGFTLQIGAGANIAARSGIDTICDFRTKDIALGGQGAPLVPIGDKLLFGKFQSCLNLGGIANISFTSNENRIAFDICPVNIALNFYAAKLGFEFDDEGRTASQGKLNIELFESLNDLSFYHESGPKSLGKEWVEKEFLPLIENAIIEDKLEITDVLRTINEHIAYQHAEIFKKWKIKGPVLVTGGGAFNKFLISRIENISQTEIFVPEKESINFKEAIIFALLGWLNTQNKTNTLASATGAKRDSIGGAYYKSN